MKKLYQLVITLFLCYSSYGQLTDGSTVPDFTFTDINGGTHNLYSYLNQGKYVAIDISATWCGPCWTYHNQKIMDSLYEKHDLPGDNTWKILFIEADESTNSADLQGTGGNTQGNWVQGSNYTIIDPPAGGALSSFKTDYDVHFYPTLFLICPNKKIVQDTLNDIPRPLMNRWEYAASICDPAGIDNFDDNNPLTIYPNPVTSVTVLYFSLSQSTIARLVVTNVLGQVVGRKEFTTLLPGDHAIKYDVSDLQPGVYIFTLSANNRSLVKKVAVQ